MDKKKVLKLISVFIFIACAVIYFFKNYKNRNNANFSGKESKYISHNNAPKKYKKNEPNKKHKKKNPQKLIQEAAQFCPELTHKINKDDTIKNTETFAHNFHFKKAGSIYRLRVFTEDTQEGSYQKLVYYKEDSDGFAHIIPIDSKKAINPTQEYIKSYLEDAEILYDSEDLNIELNSGKKLNITIENSEIVKLQSDFAECE